MKQKQEFIIGIDEAGRGPLAGSVYVGVVAIPKNYKKLFKETHAPKKLADSKKLSQKQREEWFLWIRKNKICYAYATSTAKQIDTINIARACDRAAQKAYNSLIKKYALTQGKVIADGGLKIVVPGGFTFVHYPKADELVPAVSLGSIVAKVSRDTYMERLHKKYPHYGFEKHKGYGTKEHYRALRKHGPSPVHRLTFLHASRTIRERK